MKHLAVPQFIKSALDIGGGFWWDSALHIEADVNAYGLPAEKGWALETTVYEVSNCDIDSGACGAGYRNDVGFGSPIREGIEPQLVFELTLLNPGPEVAQSFTIGYDALAWTTTQPNLKGVMQDG
jgi:hypothetical protein